MHANPGFALGFAALPGQPVGGVVSPMSTRTTFGAKLIGTGNETAVRMRVLVASCRCAMAPVIVLPGGRKEVLPKRM
jgi:hypothetical protein